MAEIRSLEQLVSDLKGQTSRRVAVAAGHDPNTIQAAAKAASENIAAVTLVGDKERIEQLCTEFHLEQGQDPSPETRRITRLGKSVSGNLK